jgi:hypothetical protein
VVLVAELEVKVADVQPTQGFVCLDTFDTPKGKRNVFDVMLEMKLERKPPEWPPMRIARHSRTDTEEGGALYCIEESGALYCIDNRRLFMHKVLCVDSARATARATEVVWMTEFDCKLKQAPPKESDRDRHWRTDDEGIAAAREELNRRLVMAQTLQDVSVGALMRALAAKRDDELSQYREEMRSLLTRVDSVNLSPPLPSEVGGTGSSGCFGAPSLSTPSGESPSSAEGVRLTQMVQEGRVAGRHLQVQREEHFPSLGGDPFPTLGAAPAMSASAKSGATEWAKLALPAAVSAGCAVSAVWAARNPSSLLSHLSVGQGKGVAQVVGRSGKSERGERAAGVGGRVESIFEMDDLDQEMCAEERQRRRTEAAAKAWETALAASAAQAGQDAGAQGAASQGATKAKKGRKGVLLVWG